MKLLAYKAAHTSASNAEFNNEWRYKSTPPYALMKYTLSIYVYVYGISYVL